MNSPYDKNIDMNLFELRGSIFSSKNCLKIDSTHFTQYSPITLSAYYIYKESMFWLSFPTGNLPTFSLQSATANITFSQESYWCNSILRSPFSFKHSRGRAFYYFEAFKAFFCTAAKSVVLNNVWKRVCENKYLRTLQNFFCNNYRDFPSLSCKILEPCKVHVAIFLFPIRLYLL